MSNTIPNYWVPINRNLAGDFIGFTFDNIHSSDFNLIRVSNGSRYESNLLPSFQDSIIQGEGKDGMFYFGSNLKEKVIKISTAFDELTEENYRRLAEIFSDKKLHKLWFDETPYKAHYVKLKTSPVFKNLCFDEGEGRERIYRGELELEFACYPTWAEARASHWNEQLPDNEFVLVFTGSDNKLEIIHNHYLEEAESSFEFTPKRFYKFYGKDGATLKDSYNFKEWEKASRMEALVSQETEKSLETFESIEVSEGVLLPIYNPGDKKADFKIIYYPNNNKLVPSTKFLIYPQNSEEGKPILYMGIKQFNLQGNDVGIVIDSRTHLISGIDKSGKLSGQVYNRYHITGDFFEVPKAAYEDKYHLKVESSVSGTWKLEYKIYYV